MYRLTIFLLISCFVQRQMVGAVRGGESPSGRSSIYFDAYDHGNSEEEELGDDLREAILMHPEEVIGVPPISRDYEMSDLINDTSSDDYPDVRPKSTRGILEDLIQHIKSVFGKIPEAQHTPDQVVLEPVTYYMEDTFEKFEKYRLRSLMDIIEKKTCLNFVENRNDPDIIFMPDRSMVAAGKKIIVGKECYEARTVAKLIFDVASVCERVLPILRPKPSSLYMSSFREEDQNECVDKISNCNNWARNGGCSSFFPIMSTLCPRTCHICGDSCMDYSLKCESNDTVKDCLTKYNRKKYSCAGTCGICKTSFPDRCVDKVHECGWLAKKGYCSKYPDVMKEYCPVSCGYCKPSVCANQRNDCSELESLGACKKTPGLMQRYCQKTCGFCEDGGKSRGDGSSQSSGTCKLDRSFIKEYCPFLAES